MTFEIIPSTNIVLATGFEAGAISLPGTGGGLIVAGNVGGAGAYKLWLFKATQQFDFQAISDMYCAFWIAHPGTASFTFTAAGVANLVTRTSAGLWASTYAAGATVGPVTGDQHIQIYYKRDGASGRLTLKVDGLTIIDFTGDTGTGTIGNLTFTTSGGSLVTYFDNLIVRSDTWPGDVRFVAKIPNSDQTAQFTPSTGTDNFAMVDGVPPDAGYVESATTGQSDLYGMAATTLTGRTVVAVTQVARVLKTTAGAQQIKLQVKSGATTSQTAALDLLTSNAYKTRILEQDPATTAAWAAVGVNALEIGQESVIP